MLSRLSKVLALCCKACHSHDTIAYEATFLLADEQLASQRPHDSRPALTAEVSSHRRRAAAGRIYGALHAGASRLAQRIARAAEAAGLRRRNQVPPAQGAGIPPAGGRPFVLVVLSPPGTPADEIDCSLRMLMSESNIWAVL